jgi:hypothetical protein
VKFKLAALVIITAVLGFTLRDRKFHL